MAKATVEIQTEYPHGLSDKEITEKINELSRVIMDSGLNVNKSFQFTPVIMLGQNELQTRQVRRATRVSYSLGGFSLLIASIALLVAVTTSRANDRWEVDQLSILEEILQANKDFK